MTGTVVVSIVVVSIAVCAVAGLLYGRGKRRGPESGPARPGATVGAAAPTAAGAFMAVDAPAEPFTRMRDTPAAARRRSGNTGARRFGPAGSNVRAIRSIQTR
jgi:hypothetical protein